MLKVADAAIPVLCWSCAVAHNNSALFCPHCRKIQPPSGSDYFAVFGSRPHLNLDLEALEQEFHRLSRKVHPDRFARAGANERQWSLADTALLNDAYRTLKDPLRRTEYLLKLNGALAGEENAASDARGGKDVSGPKNSSRVPTDLLEEVFELNMQFEQSRAERGRGEIDPEIRAGLDQAKQRFEGLLAGVDRDLRAQWNVWDEGDEATRASSERAMAALLDRRRFLSNLVRDVNEALGAS